MANTEYDLCVIGGGAAGLVVAAGGAALGAKVALIEKDRLGGDCLYYGCVPSKSLLHCGKVAHTMRQAGRFGMRAVSPDIELAHVMQRVQSVIETIEPHDSPERFRSLGVEVFFGAGRFIGPRMFELDGRRFTARHFVLATGSRPRIPDLPGLDAVPYLTNETVFALREPVASLVVLGSGPIGLEMAQAFSRLGSRVSVIARGPQVLSKEDGDMADVVHQRLQKEGVKFYLGHATLGVSGRAGGLSVRIRDPERRESELEASHLLVATGRQANVEELGLDQAQVQVLNGYVHTDGRMRTNNKYIYACGDVTGHYLFTHMAEHQAGVVLRNTLFRLPAKMEQRAIPWCTFTDPELARVGLSEREALSQGTPYTAHRFPFDDIDRARTDGVTAGCAKILTDRKGRLLGAAIAGAQAGELIHEYVLAMAHNMKAGDLSRAIHIYPTLAQINRRVADSFLKQRLTPRAKKWMRRLFRLRGPTAV